MATVVNENSQVYYSGDYWNELPRVLEYMSENFTGDRTRWWTADFAERFCQQPFQHALFLNCGNGWVEREFLDRGLVVKATAFDYSNDLLKSAEEERGGRPITYFQADANRVELEADQYDLVVNVASLHHVQYIDRICRMLCRALKPGGLIVSCDYIGPSRNQYSRRHWSHIKSVNRSMPAAARKQPLRHPHLPTMLVMDPTEAIHSDLIMETLARYFDIIERHDTGGGIAYELLTHNARLKELSPAELDPIVENVLRADRDYTRTGAVPQMFSYFLARPRKASLDDSALLDRYRSEEEDRELHAAQWRGAYSRRQYLMVLGWPLVARAARVARLK
ncbi:MAG TPA: methyltransferase domain-containing protein [Candidatus Solibacter sp.]|jgi:SAM-dependent methyltransferase|nr:methyltransferase domain-containing protein [Candidatus Solibacter sp.]